MPRDCESPLRTCFEQEGFTTPECRESAPVLPVKRVRDEDDASGGEGELASPRKLSPRRLDMDDAGRVVLACDVQPEEEEEVEVTQKYEEDEDCPREEGETVEPDPPVRTLSTAF